MVTGDLTAYGTESNSAYVTFMKQSNPCYLKQVVGDGDFLIFSFLVHEITPAR